MKYWVIYAAGIAQGLIIASDLGFGVIFLGGLSGGLLIGYWSDK